MVQYRREYGFNSTPSFNGYLYTRERNSDLSGINRWLKFADISTNVSIVATGIRHFASLVSSTDWFFDPADPDSSEAREVADMVTRIVHDMDTPWTRVVRRMSMFRFHGFGVHEWVAARRRDGEVGLRGIYVRPPHTIDRWDRDDKGHVLGFYQGVPFTSATMRTPPRVDVRIPREKTIYLVDDTLTDSPEGAGILRHLVEPADRLRRYLDLEIKGFERDLRGIPVARAPYAEVRRMVEDKTMTETEAEAYFAAIENFVRMEAKDNDTAIVLDSSHYVSDTNDGGSQVSNVPLWDVSLLTAQTSGLPDLGNAIGRVNREMARLMGIEHILLGESSGSRALSEDKSRNFYLVVNSANSDIAFSVARDLVPAVCQLNGVSPELYPKTRVSEIAFRSVVETTEALKDMAIAGVTLEADDPIVNDIRRDMGFSEMPPDVAARLVDRAEAQNEPEKPVDTTTDRATAASDARSNSRRT